MRIRFFKRKENKMSALDDAITTVVNDVAALQAAQAADVPVTVGTTPDTLRTVVETQLTSEGWTAPATQAAEEATEASA